MPSVLRLLPRPFLPPLWRELAGLERFGAWAGDVSPPAAERAMPVLLIPGLFAGDGSLRPVARALRAAGHEPQMAGIRCNVGCSEAAVARLTQRLERLADTHGAPVALVGHSRGGLFARVLAQRRSQLVSSVVTLASPLPGEGGLAVLESGNGTSRRSAPRSTSTPGRTSTTSRAGWRRSPRPSMAAAG